MNTDIKTLNNKKEQVAIYLFYLAYFIELGMVLIDKSAYTNPLEGRLFQVTFLLCFLKVLLTKYNWKEILLMLGFGLVGAISYYATDRNEVIRVVMFIAASKNIEAKQLIKCTFYVTAIGVGILMILSALGIFGWNYIEGDFDGDGPEGVMRRYCFGLGHPNAFHCMLWSIILLGVYHFFDKIKWYHYVILAVFNAFMMCFTDSKTAGYVLYGTLLLGVLFRYGKWIRESIVIYLSGIISVVGMVGFSIICAIYGQQNRIPILNWIDSKLTGRIWAAEYLGGIHTWSLFSVEMNQEYFDMGYIRLFYWYGIIPAILYVITVCLFLWYCYKKKDYKVFLVVIMISFYTLVEAHTISVYFARNYIYVLLFGVWSQVFFAEKGIEDYIWLKFLNLVKIKKNDKVEK